MTKKECKIIQDILPNYIEKITSSETNEYVSQHLEKCQYCYEIYNDMTKEFYKSEKNTSKDIDYLKKHKKKLQILKMIILLISFVVISLIIKKFVVFNLIETRAQNQNFNNYYVKMKETATSRMVEWEMYYKDGNFIVINNKHTLSGNETIYNYKYAENKIQLIEKDGKKDFLDSEPVYLEHYNFLHKNFVGNLGLAITPNSLSQIKFAGKQCYIVKLGKDYLNIIDKETGLTIKEINLKNNITVDYEYSFGTVTDDDIQNLNPNK